MKDVAVLINFGLTVNVFATIISLSYHVRITDRTESVIIVVLLGCVFWAILQYHQKLDADNYNYFANLYIEW